MAWIRDRLEDVARDRLRGAKLIVVANREPYLHTFDGDEIRCTTPASTTALDRAMRACGGTWVAHGSGDADLAASDAGARVMVPPAQPIYTLWRMWLTLAEEQQVRMAPLRREVADNNAYRWAGMLRSEASKLVQVRQAVDSRSSAELPV